MSRARAVADGLMRAVDAKARRGMPSGIRIAADSGAKIKIGGYTRRVEDGTRHTRPPDELVKATRRRMAKRAKESRRANR